MREEQVHMQSYMELQSFLDSQRARHRTVTEWVKRLTEEQIEALADFDEAVLTGGDPDSLKDRLDSLDREITHKLREQTLLEAAIMGKTTAGKLVDLAQAVVAEAYKLIPGMLREEWDVQAEKVRAAREAFLKAVIELGRIYQRASSITARASEATEFLHSPKPGVPSLATGIYKQNKQGIIYISPEESESFFFKGGE
jgi:hypothetical protein